MRSNGRRPKVRHAIFAEAQEEARRVAANYPPGLVDVWVVECRTVDTVKSTGSPALDGGHE
jgi:hypothetical protein